MIENETLYQLALAYMGGMVTMSILYLLFHRRGPFD